jgi:NIMA (never in mitosis gene a)-related kinase
MHRDLKPGNIFIYGTSLVIGDLGIAKSIEELKRSKTFSCTLFYASPEVVNKEDFSFLADIW